jgi:hypothetical protein
MTCLSRSRFVPACLAAVLVLGLLNFAAARLAKPPTWSAEYGPTASSKPIAAKRAAGRITIDLADIVGGGDGTGTGSELGIDQRYGIIAYGQEFDTSLPDDTFDYNMVFDYDAVDGVFIPDGGAGPNEINSLGMTVEVPVDTSRESWCVIWNGPNLGGSSILDGVDYLDPGHSMIGIHASKGITFDLDYLEYEYGEEATRFTCMFGLDSNAGPEGSADFWIYLDDNLVAYVEFVTPGDGAFAFDVPIPASTQFLTLITTDGGDGYLSDDAMLGDPTLHLGGIVEPPDATFMAVNIDYSPDELIAFNTNAIGGVNPSDTLATLDGNFVRGIEFDAPNHGWYIIGSSVLGDFPGIYEYDDGSSYLLQPLPFNTNSGGGLSLSQFEDNLWLVIDPDYIDPDNDGPHGYTVYEVDKYSGEVYEGYELWPTLSLPFAVNGIAMDHATGLLYGFCAENNVLLTINPFNGYTDVVGPLGMDAFGLGGLDFSYDNQHLVMTQLTGGPGEASVHLIDRDTGQVTQNLGLLPFGCTAIAGIEGGFQNLCPWDTAGDEGPDGFVGTNDFFALLQNWGPCVDPDDCPWDTAGDEGPDGEVGVDDFFALLQNWGPCPEPD